MASVKNNNEIIKTIIINIIIIPQLGSNFNHDTFFKTWKNSQHHVKSCHPQSEQSRSGPGTVLWYYITVCSVDEN